MKAYDERSDWFKVVKPLYSGETAMVMVDLIKIWG